MAFKSTGLACIVDGLSGYGPRLFEYTSTDSSTQVGGIVGYFSGQGRSFNSNVTKGGPLSIGDIVLNRESSAGATPQRITFHAVNASTLNSTVAATIPQTTSAYDVTVSFSCTG